MKDELGRKFDLGRFVGVRKYIYSYLLDDGNKNKKAKGTKKCVTKGKLKFENYTKIGKQLNLKIK